MKIDPDLTPCTVAGRQGWGRENNECYNKTEENWSWGILPGDQKRVISPRG
jgi:hypothetical protein